MVDDCAHAAELLIELSAFHADIFFSLVMREQAIAETGTEGVCWNEHPTLHHQLRQADTAKEGRFAPRVGTCDDHNVLRVSIRVVADHSSVDGQRETNVV